MGRSPPEPQEKQRAGRYSRRTSATRTVTSASSDSGTSSAKATSTPGCTPPRRAHASRSPLGAAASNGWYWASVENMFSWKSQPSKSTRKAALRLHKERPARDPCQARPTAAETHAGSVPAAEPQKPRVCVPRKDDAEAHQRKTSQENTARSDCVCTAECLCPCVACRQMRTRPRRACAAFTRVASLRCASRVALRVYSSSHSFTCHKCASSVATCECARA